METVFAYLEPHLSEEKVLEQCLVVQSVLVVGVRLVEIKDILRQVGGICYLSYFILRSFYFGC